MSAPQIFLTALQHCFLTACIALFELGQMLLLVVRPRAAWAVENRFLCSHGTGASSWLRW